MQELKIQTSEISEHAKLELDLGPQVEFATDTLSETDYRFEKMNARMVVDRVGSGSIRVWTDIELWVNFMCGRCLDKRAEKFVGDSEFILMSKSELTDRIPNEEIELDASDLNVLTHNNESIDLKPLFREAILETLPDHALCLDKDQEECQKSFEKNVGESVVKELEEAQIDLRWGPLLELKKKQNKD